MDKKTKTMLIKNLEEAYKENKSFISVVDLSAEEADFLLNTSEIFFPASKSRVIMVHWLMREIRRVYEKVEFVPVDMANEVYEYLRKSFNTKAFNKVKLLNIFGLTSNTIVSFEKFSEIEDKYIDYYNDIVPNEMKLPKTKHIYVPKTSENQDLRQELEELLKKKRIEGVLYQRANGKTLESIGQEYSITRERARQIEIKPKALIERWMNEKKDELIKVFGGKILADPKKALSCFTEVQWAILKYCASSKGKTKFSDWYFIKDLDTICYSKDFEQKVFDILSECANNNMTEKDAFAKIKEVYEFVQEKQIPKFYKTAGIYAYDGKLYSSKVNIGRGIIVAVNEKFKDGIKISDEKQLKEFSDYLNETFGLHTKPNRALTARIQDILVMSDKATYKSPEQVIPSDKLDEKIKKYVSEMENDRTTYQLFFAAMPKDLMKACGITTFSGLHGYVKMNEEKLGVVALRYYICKGGTVGLKSKDFFEKFAVWLKEIGKPCTTEEVKKQFDGWTDMYPKYAMLYFPQIVQWGNGTYFNLDCIQVSDSAVEQAKRVLDEATKNRLKYTNSYVVYPKLRTNASEFVSDERIKTESHAYLLLKYRLTGCGEYIFAKPHILKESATSGKPDFTTEDLIRAIIGKKNMFSKAEVVEEAQRLYGSKNSSLCLATQHVLEDYCRVSVKDYYRKASISMNKKDVAAIEDFVKKHMLNGDVMIPSKADGYEKLPKMPFEWNSWSLCSCIEMFSTKYRVIFKKNNILQNNMIIIPVASKFETRQQIAAAVVNENYNGEKNEESIALYLKNIGIYNQSVPFDLIRKEGLKFETSTNKAS